VSHELWILIPAAFAASALSGAIGMGGGVLLLAVMATVLAPPLVVPLHGVVQLTSNTTRAVTLFRRVDWQIVLFYCPTLVAGVFLGLQLYRGSGMIWFRPLIGLFVIAFLAWDRFRPKRLQMPRWVFFPAGLLGGAITILIGASGPYLAAFFLRDDMDRESIIATKALVQTVGHLLKIPAFLAIDFDYPANLHLLLPLLGCAVGGTLLGTWALQKMGEGVFRIIFRVVLLGLGLRLLADPWI
jgi:uncharacterized membrane protein YfcA